MLTLDAYRKARRIDRDYGPRGQPELGINPLPLYAPSETELDNPTSESEGESLIIDSNGEGLEDKV